MAWGPPMAPMSRGRVMKGPTPIMLRRLRVTAAAEVEGAGELGGRFDEVEFSGWLGESRKQ